MFYCKNCEKNVPVTCAACDSFDIVEQGSSQVDMVIMPVFMVNVNYHPEYKTISDWQKMTMKQYMDEYDVGIDEINEMLAVKQIRLVEIRRA